MSNYVYIDVDPILAKCSDKVLLEELQIRLTKDEILDKMLDILEISITQKQQLEDQFKKIIK